MDIRKENVLRLPVLQLPLRNPEPKREPSPYYGHWDQEDGKPKWVDHSVDYKVLR